MFDFTFSLALRDFSATEVEVAANTAPAIALLESLFGKGANGATFPKSRVGDFVRFVEQKGFKWECAA